MVAEIPYSYTLFDFIDKKLVNDWERFHEKVKAIKPGIRKKNIYVFFPVGEYEGGLVFIKAYDLEEAKKMASEQNFEYLKYIGTLEEFQKSIEKSPLNVINFGYKEER